LSQHPASGAEGLAGLELCGAGGKGQRVQAAPRPGWRPAGEGAGPRAGDTEDPAEPLDAVGVTVIGDEPETADRIVSWAK
jgi:hypothetical protein